VWIAGAVTLAFVVLAEVLAQAHDVLGWVAIAVLLALTLDIPVGFLQRRRVPRPVAALLVMGALVAAAALLLTAMVPPLAAQARAFAAELPELARRSGRPAAIAWLREHLTLTRLREAAHTHAGEAAGEAFVVARAALRAAAAVVTILVLAVFMLAFGPALGRTVLGWLPPVESARVARLASEMKEVLGRYLLGVLGIALLGGVLASLTLAALGVPFYLPLGAVMALLGVVPFVGSIVGGILMTGAAALTVGVHAGLAALAIFVGYHQMENHLLQPLINRRTVQMNPLGTILVALLGGAMGGVLGALLAMPTAAAAKVVLRHLHPGRRAPEPGRSPASAPAAPAGEAPRT
jgi:predicted PurR-regulated permease PerM